jgi:hypothetical protein
MKKTLLLNLFVSFALLVGFSYSAKGQTVIASWSFDDLVTSADGSPTASVINADNGVLSANATVYLDGTNGSSSWVSGTASPELTAFTGTTLADPRPSPAAGMALVLANSDANGKSVVFKFSTTGYSGIVALFATRGTGTGFDTHTWEWSTDNSTYNALFIYPANKTPTWTVEVLDLRSISEIDNASEVYLKLTVTGCTSASGNNRIDNFVVVNDELPPIPIFDPYDSEVDVALSVTPTITFDESVQKTDGSSLENADLASLITFKKTDASGEDVPFTATIDVTKTVITITPSSQLDGSQLYYLAVGPVEDANGNESTDYAITFTTISATAPTITVTYPDGGEVVYSGDTETITWTTTNFDPGENVKVEVWEYDSEDLIWEWFTLAESTPNDGELEVVVGPDALYGTDYVIAISGVTNGAYDESDAPFTVISTADNLADLRKYPIGNHIKYTGTATVTYARTSYNQKYIQDNTAAILIHDPSGNVSGTYSIGDGITNVEGNIEQYGGLLELVPYDATGESATGPVITPAVVNIANLTSDDQCKLVKVENQKFANPNQYDPGGLFESGRNYELTGLSATDFAFRTNFSESDYIGTSIPTGFFDAVVLVGQYNSQIQITTRNLADFTILTGINNTVDNDILIYPVPASTVLNIKNIINVSSVEIRDITGKVIIKLDNLNQQEIKIPVGNLARGMYFLKLTTPEGKIIKRFIKS